MAIRIEDKRTIIGGVVASRPGPSVVPPAGGERCRMECADASAIRSAETQVAPARRDNGPGLLGDREFDAGRARRIAVVRALPFMKVDDPHQSERLQSGIVKRAAALDVADSQ